MTPGKINHQDRAPELLWGENKGAQSIEAAGTCYPHGPGTVRGVAGSQHSFCHKCMRSQRGCLWDISGDPEEPWTGTTLPNSFYTHIRKSPGTIVTDMASHGPLQSCLCLSPALQLCHCCAPHLTEEPVARRNPGPTEVLMLRKQGPGLHPSGCVLQKPDEPGWKYSDDDSMPCRAPCPSSSPPLLPVTLSFLPCSQGPDL